MAAITHPMVADRGATFRLAARYLTPAGDPVDLTGYTAALVRLPMSDGAALSTHAAATLGSDGWVRVTVADEVTALWETGRTAYRLEVTNPSGEVDYLLVGPFTVRSPASA